MKIDININRKRLFCLFLLVFIMPKCYSQYWERNLGDPETLEYIYDLDESYDNGYILGTVLVDEISPNLQDYVISSFIYKTDINGDTLWSRNFRNDPCLIYASRNVGDGTSIALFDTWNYEYECTEIIIARINQCGNKMWCKKINYDLECGVQSYDLEIINNRVVLCREFLCDDLDSKYDILIFDLNGEKISEKPFLLYEDHPLMNSPWMKHLLPLPNNEFMMLGMAYYRENTTSPAWLRALFVKFDSEGNEQWVLPFGLKDTIISVFQNCENVIIQDTARYFAFSCTYSNSDPLELLLMKFNDSGFENGHVISDIDTVFNYGFSPHFIGASKISNNRYLGQLKFGVEEDPNHSGTAAIVVDSIINVFYDTLIFSGFNLTSTKCKQTFDGKYITGGYDLPYDEVQAYMNKISINPLSFDTMYTTPYTYDSLCTENIVYADTIYFDDCLYVGDEEIELNQTTKYPIHLYPNPTDEELTISIVNPPRKEPLEVIIYTLTGEIKWQGVLQPGEQSKRLSVYSWAKGVYIITACMGDEVVGREKVVVV